MQGCNARAAERIVIRGNHLRGKTSVLAEEIVNLIDGRLET
jgi:hypothetical protein